jgi:hypothetical protein
MVGRREYNNVIQQRYNNVIRQNEEILNRTINLPLKEKVMKFKIYSHISKDKIKRIVPKPFHGNLPLNLKDDYYSIIIFSGSKDQVFISSIVIKALCFMD